MKKTGLVLALILAASVITGCYGVDVSDVGSIGGSPIYKKEFLFYAEQSKSNILLNLRQQGQPITDLTDPNITYVEEGKTVADAAKEEAEFSIKTMYVLAAKAADYGFTIDDEARKSISKLKEDLMTKSAGKVDKLGLTNKDFERIAEKQYLASMVQGELSKDESLTEVPDDEILKEYNEIYASAKHILINKNLVPEQYVEPSGEGEPGDEENALEEETADPVEKARKTAEEIVRRIKNGENFDKLMKEFSEDPGLESNPDGYVFTKGEMVQEFEDAVFALNVGEITETPIESIYGFHIIKRESLPTEGDTFEAKKSAIKSKLLDKKFHDKIDELGADMDIKFDKEAIKRIKF